MKDRFSSVIKVSGPRDDLFEGLWSERKTVTVFMANTSRSKSPSLSIFFMRAEGLAARAERRDTSGSDLISKTGT
jgi:hypothetical protein